MSSDVSELATADATTADFLPHFGRVQPEQRIVTWQRVCQCPDCLMITTVTLESRSLVVAKAANARISFEFGMKTKAEAFHHCEKPKRSQVLLNVVRMLYGSFPSSVLHCSF